MKTKLTRISKRSLAMLLSVLMLVSAFVVMGTVTASAWSNIGTIFYDNAKTNWANVYCFIGHSGYVRAYQMSATGNPKVFKIDLGGWSDRSKFFFASSAKSGMTDGTSSYNIDSTITNLTSGSYTGKFNAADDNGGKTYYPASASNGAALSAVATKVLASGSSEGSSQIASASWSTTADVMNYDGSKWYITYSGKAAGSYAVAVTNYNTWDNSIKTPGTGTNCTVVDNGGNDHNVKITLDPNTESVTISTTGSSVDASAVLPVEPSISLSTDKNTLYIGGGVTDTATITTTKENTSATPSYSVTKDGSTATSSHYTFNSSTGVFTPKVTGTFVITGSITDGSTYTDSVTITVSDRVVYLLGLTNEGTWTPTDSGNKANKMTYNSSTSLYELTINLYQSNTTYNGNNGFKIQDAGVRYGKNSTTLTTSSTSASGLTTSGGNLAITTKNIGGSSTVPYKFTYDASTKAVTVYYPMKVTFSKNGHGSSDPPTQVVAYGSTATNPGTLTASDGYTHNGKWYTESSCTNEFSFSTAITQDYNLYAKWTGAQKVLKVQAGIKTTSSGSYTLDDTTTAALTMDGSALTPAGSSGSKYQTKNVAVGDTCTLVAPNKGSGYTFLGWYNGSTRVSTNAQYTYTHTMANDDTTLVARYERKYTLTITADSNGKVNTNQNSVSETVFYDDAPDSFTINPNAGYIFDTENNATLLKYYTVSNNSATGKAANSIASADKVNTNITVNFVEHLPTVNFTSYKTDNAVTYTAGGGAVTAKYYDAVAPEPDPDPTPSGGPYYLHIGKQNDFVTNEAIEFTWNGSYYYASYNVDTANAEYPFVINTKNETLGDSDKSSSNQSITSLASSFNPDEINMWYTPVYNSYYGYDAFKFGVNSGSTGTIYITFTPSGGVTFRTSVSSGSGGSGSGGSSSSGTVTSGGTVPYGANVTFTAEASAVVSGETYQFVGWYSTSTPANNETALSTNTTYTVNSVTSDVTVYARYKKSCYLTFYNSYVQEANGKFTFVAAPPRTVTVGMGNTVRATYSYKAGNAEQRGEDQTKNSTSDYYEGNRLLVLVGETVTLKFSTLASSDAITGIFFNNAIRYTTETEPDNLYMNRVNQGIAAHGGNSTGTLKDLSHPDQGYTNGDDEWDYTYLPDTTIYADEDYYEGDTKTTIQNNASSYIGQSGMDQAAHTVSWVATQSYMNIDIELGRKYQLHINDDKPDGISIANMNDEGYYYRGEDFDSNFKISIEQPTDGSGTYSFTDTNVAYVDKDGNSAVQPTGMTVTAKKANGTNASTASEISYFLVTGEMPGQNVYIQLPIVKKFKMKLANIVVADNIDSKTMLTETNGYDTSATGHIGTISAIPKKGNTTGSDISSDSTYYTYRGNNSFNQVNVYDNANNNSNYYLKGGVNKGGSDVEKGYSVTYTFSFASGKDADYSFVGWFEGTQSGDGFTVDYSKKLSGKTSFTYTPTKNTTVIAVGTRDLYLGGNFTSAGAYTSTSGSQTWESNRIRMNYDPTYVNPSDSTKKGRYYYTFDSVTSNTEYKFRVYDKVSGSQFTDLAVWNAHLSDIHGYMNDDDDVADYRSKYDSGHAIGWTTHGGFMYTTETNKKFEEIKVDGTAQDESYRTISKNHQANGYAAPVTVYFYPYDSGVSVDATYQWSKAYVSAGCGIDVVNPDASSGKYNVPSVSVASTTVGGKTVDVSYQQTKYGAEKDKNNKTINKFEKIYECTVKEKDGQISVTANPNDENLCVQAFLIYNIDTKESEAITVESSGGAVTQNITVPQNSKLYIVPIYKFTDAYIQSAGLETHNVYVRADEIDKDDWGGLVSMYSWGSDSRYDSGGWPGQLMIPSDDGSSFYAPLTFSAGGLAGVTFSNYTQVWGGKFVNFLGTYQEQGVSDTVYSSYTNTSTHYINQVYDYREPISIIENINEGGIYDSEDMDLTFALKQGNKNGTNFGAGTYSASYDWEYLTDRSGKKRVDLNGNALSTNSTATYYVVCSYTRDYVSGGSKNYDFVDGDRDGTTTHNCYSIEWTVYDQEHTKIGSEKLSAAFTDIYKSEMLTYIAKMLDNYGYPVSGKAVQIAYEDPKESLKNESNNNTEAKRFSGQWYADGVNSLIEGNVRVGIYSDGAWTPSDTNAPGYATATVGVKSGAGFTIPNSTTGEQYVQEDGCSGNSLVKVTKKHATDGNITYTVSTTDNFLGWYRDDGEGGFEPVGSNYKNQTITPSFNSDITYYAFYSASASYRFAYTSRTGSTKYYTAKGTDLTDAELANSGTLNPTTRSADITAKLAGVNDIKVFNHKLNYDLTSPDTSSPYTITYTAGDSPSTYTLTVYAYNSSGTLAQVGSKNGTWNTSLDVNNDLTTYASGFSKGSKLVNNKPSDHGNYIFLGWRKYNGSAFEGPILSTKENFGYSITSDTTIAPYFVDPTNNTIINYYISEAWKPGVDNSVVTQELTKYGEGVIYNDNLISFRYGSDTNKRIDGSSIYSNELNTVPEGKQCGVVVLAQANDATDGQKTTFNNQYSADSHVQSSVNYFVTGAGTEKSSVKLSSSKYGDAYAFHVKAETLSNLNRANIVQALDYAKFSGGNYKVMSYYYDGSTIVYSDVTSGTLTCSK